jgi:hypothetical protein
MTKFAKGDLVRVHATKFNGDPDNVDELGLTYSERMLRDRKGEWCYGKISLFFTKKKSRQPQKYKIKYHEGGSMDSLEGDIEMAPKDEDLRARRDSKSELEDDVPLNIEDREEDEDRHPLDRDDGEENRSALGDDGTVELDSDEDDEDKDETVTVGGLHYNISAKRKRETVDTGQESDINMGETVTVGEYTWRRVEGIEEDSRTEPHFDTTFKTKLFNNEAATGVEIFRALMPMSKSALLNIVRDNAEEENDKRVWLGWHIDAAIAIIFGGAQFKEETDLWATQRVGIMPSPDFGRHLSQDRFHRILRYWARGLPKQREAVKDNPLAQIGPWAEIFNEARMREIKPGSCLTPDEMMFI